YADVGAPDATTARLRARVHQWRNIFGLSDGRLTQLIAQDGIDLLVDLAGHTAGNRLRVFARRPAPVQLTYLGYPTTTRVAGLAPRPGGRLHPPPGRARRSHRGVGPPARGLLLLRPSRGGTGRRPAARGPDRPRHLRLAAQAGEAEPRRPRHLVPIAA